MALFNRLDKKQLDSCICRAVTSGRFSHTSLREQETRAMKRQNQKVHLAARRVVVTYRQKQEV